MLFTIKLYHDSICKETSLCDNRKIFSNQFTTKTQKNRRKQPHAKE